MVVEKKNAIDLSKYGRTWGDLRRIQEQLLSILYPVLFEIHDFQTLIYLSLKQFEIVSNEVENEEQSIEDAIVKVITALDLQSNVSKNNPYDYYTKNILGLEDTPKGHYMLLRDNVQDDLRKISLLIERYETEEKFIQKYIKKTARPNNHKEAVLYEFYNRCLSEQKEILNYYLYGLKERAVQKSKYSVFGLSRLFTSFEWVYDYPYKLRRPFSEEYFDHKKISKVSHRLAEIGIALGDRLFLMYQEDKGAFYEKLFHEIPTEQYWTQIQYYINLLPQISERNFIFKELELLFQQERWLAFYALALPQVEGLFTDMTSVTHPHEDVKSLPEKVGLVRPYYSLSESYFDYYQYIIPDLRNTFAHTGKDTLDFRLSSFDCLTDLHHLLIVYSSLDKPYIGLEHIYKNKNVNDFASFKEYGKYFGMLSELQSNDKPRFGPMLEKHKQLESKFILTECSFEYTCYQTIEIITRELAMLVANFKDPDLTKKLPKKISMAKKVGDLPPEIVSRHKRFDEHIQNIKHLDVFIEGIPTFMSPKTNALQNIQLLKTAWKENQTVVKNILRIDKLCSLKE